MREDLKKVLQENGVLHQILLVVEGTQTTTGIFEVFLVDNPTDKLYTRLCEPSNPEAVFNSNLQRCVLTGAARFPTDAEVVAMGEEIARRVQKKKPLKL